MGHKGGREISTRVAQKVANSPSKLEVCFLFRWAKVIINNRRLQYEERASASPLDYDNWFDYLRLEESTGDIDRAREVRDPIGRTALPSVSLPYFPESRENWRVLTCCKRTSIDTNYMFLPLLYSEFHDLTIFLQGGAYL